MILKAFVILLALTLPVAAAPYHSNPFATNVLYVNRTAVPWTAPDEVVDPILALVAQIFTGFNLDITDEFPGFRYNVVQVVVGGPITNGAAGMSGIGPWKQGTYYDQFSDQHIFAAYVYADGLGNELIQTADAISHEGGHNIGLQHQSQGIMWKYINNDPRQLFWTKGKIGRAHV